MSDEPKKPKKQVHWSKGKLTPESRTIRYLESRGWDCWITEQRLQWRRIDLYNAFDLVAQTYGRIIGVQATAGGNAAARQAKMDDNEHVDMWISHSDAFVFEWRQPAKNGGLWIPSIRVKMGSLPEWRTLSKPKDKNDALGYHTVHEVDE